MTDPLDILNIDKALFSALVANGRQSAEAERNDRPFDPEPLVKLFTPWAGATWLLTEIDPDDTDIAFGLCDLGLGTPELGAVSLAELARVNGPGGLRIERDIYFHADGTLEAYVQRAREAGRISA